MAIYPGAYTQYWNTRATANRRVTPFILAAIHITDNTGLMSAMNEAIYSNRIGTGASFTFVNNRNGTTVQCLHPEYQVPFTNGSWLYPNRSLWTVNHSIANGIGANDSTFMTIENVGSERVGAGLTAAQIEKCAQMIAYYSKRTGIAINRATVLGHRDYDSYNRMNCPTRYDLNALLGKIITRANQIKSGTAPTTSTTLPGAWPVKFKEKRRYGTIKANYWMLKAPSPTAEKHAIRDYPIKRYIIGSTLGGEINGSRVWYFFWSPNSSTTTDYDGRLVFVHRSGVEF